MPTIIEGHNWKTDHESSLSFADMQALIQQITTQVPGMDDPPDATATEFKSLSLVLRDKKQGVIFLLKGIHQDNELHYNLQCVAAGGNSEFHIFIGKGPAQMISTMALKPTPMNKKLGIDGQSAQVPLYTYKNVGLSWRQHGNSPLLQFPAQFSKNSYPGRKRGNSLSVGNSSGITSRGVNAEEKKALIEAAKKTI